MSVEQPAQNTSRTALEELDATFEPLGSLGQGGFGSVLLAKKKSSGRRVALKFIYLTNTEDGSSEDAYEAFQREVQAVEKLNCPSLNKDENDSRDLAIVFFEDYLVEPGSFACIVMKYVDGGTLAQEIESKDPNTSSEPYTERRIAWYALQLAEALAYAHERGVAHHDVKSSNVLIDRTSGGKLLLADFGSAVRPGEDSVGFTKSYASPELLDAYQRDDYSDIQADKIDSYGLGCILFELLCCRRMTDLTIENDQTLAEIMQSQERGVEAALNLGCVRLPWLSATEPATNVVGYSDALRNLIKTLLQPRPSHRWTPSQLQKPLRSDPKSPLLHDYVVAAQPPLPGAPVMVDNVQLGMFVQRGRDWEDPQDTDGGPGKVGVVTQLDADALYVEVTWPCPPSGVNGDCYRIGAGNKFELQVGPTPLVDFYHATDSPRWTGIVEIPGNEASRPIPGQKINDNCLVVAVHPDQKRLLVAPLETIVIPPRPIAPLVEPTIAPIQPRTPQPPPNCWQPDSGSLVEVTDLREKGIVIESFYSNEGGMGIQDVEIVSIKRVQMVNLWRNFAQASESVAAENWGVSNQQRLFVGTRGMCPETLLRSLSDSSFVEKCENALSGRLPLSKGARAANRYAHRATTGMLTIVLSRVALGRVLKGISSNESSDTSVSLTYHSITPGISLSGDSVEFFYIMNNQQAYPEYIITYKQNRRIVRGARPPGLFVDTVGSPPAATNNGRTRMGASTPPEPAISTTSPVGVQPAAPSIQQETPPTTPKTKLCVVCLSHPVNRILLPCGHPCLCQLCSTEQGLNKLRRKCPECRTPIREAANFYGRVVED